MGACLGCVKEIFRHTHGVIGACLLLVAYWFFLSRKLRGAETSFYPSVTRHSRIFFKSVGGILGGSAAWGLMRLSYYFWTSDLGVELGATITVVAGALLCLPACWVAALVPYHPKSVSLSATLMVVVTAAMLLLSSGLGALSGLTRALRDPGALNASMQRALSLDSCDSSVKSSFAAMQLELKCCGVHSYTDWYQHRRTLPPACCGRAWNGKADHIKEARQCEVPLYSSGCLHPAIKELRAFVNSLSALASCAVFALAVTLFAAAYFLVTSVVERSEARSLKPHAMRIACLEPCAPPGLVSFTSPVALANPAM